MQHQTRSLYRRENIKIFGIEDTAGESNDKTEELVRNMLQDKMKIPQDDVDSIKCERVQRITTRRDKEHSSKPRPIIIKFSFYHDKEYMWSFVKNLKGSGICIANDFPRDQQNTPKNIYGFERGK